MSMDNPYAFIFVATVLATQGWMLKEIINLKIAIARLLEHQEIKMNINLNRSSRTAKNVILALVGTSILALGMGALTGCGTVGQSATNAVGNALLTGKAIVSQATNLVPVVSRSETVTESAVVATNPVTHLTVTNLVNTTNTVNLTNLVSQTETVTNTVFEAKPALQTALNTAQLASGFLPPPYGQLAEVGLSGLALGLAWLVKRKNKANTSLAGQLEAVVGGVEKAADLFPETAKVKAQIANEAQNLGVSVDLHKFVQSVT